MRILSLVLICFITIQVGTSQSFEEFRKNFTEKTLPYELDTFPMLTDKVNKFPFTLIADPLVKRYLPGLLAPPYYSFRITLPYGYTGLITYTEQSLGCCKNALYELHVFDESGKMLDQFAIAHDFSQKDPGNGVDLIHDVETATIDQFGKIKITNHYYTMSKGAKSNEKSTIRTLTLLKSGQLEGK